MRRVIPHGPAEQVAGHILAVGEIVYDETNKEMRLGDGETFGGLRAADGKLRDDLAKIGPTLLAYARGDALNPYERGLDEVLGATVYAEDWGVLGDNSETATLKDGTVVTMGEAAQNCLDEAPIWSTVVWPNGPIRMGQTQLNQTRPLNHEFQRNTDMRFERSTTSDEAGFRINVKKDLNNGVAENRMMRFEGNGGRIWLFTPASLGGTTTVNEGGSYALTIADEWNATDPGGADFVPHIQCSFSRLRLGGGKLGALMLDGPNPFMLTPGISYPETHFVRFYDCLFDGGVYDRSSDGNLFADCNVVGDEFCAYTLDKVPGAYLTAIVGGTSNCGNGNLRVINGEMVWMIRHQAEITFSYGDSGAPFGSQIYFEGRDRPCNHCGVLQTNVGGGNRISNTIAIGNARGTVLEDIQFGATQFQEGDGSDLYLSDSAIYVHLSRPHLSGPETLGAVALRTEQAPKVATDPSRRMRVSHAGTIHRNPHYGLWLNLGGMMVSNAGDPDNGEFLSGWTPDATRGLEYLLDPATGHVHLQGKLSGGDAAGAVCNWPKHIRPAFDTRIPCITSNIVQTRPHSASGGIGEGVAFPDQNLWLDGISWPVPIRRDWYAGIF